MNGITNGTPVSVTEVPNQNQAGQQELTEADNSTDAPAPEDEAQIRLVRTLELTKELNSESKDGVIEDIFRISQTSLGFMAQWRVKDAMVKHTGKSKSDITRIETLIRQELAEAARVRLLREGGELSREFMFVEEQGKFFSKSSKVCSTPQAFNQARPQQYSNEGDSISAQAAFKQQGGQVVDSLGWQPCAYGYLPEPILHRGGRQLANLYRPLPVLAPNEDEAQVRLWLDLAKYLVPDERERNILFDHMSATLQRPDIKIQWQILWIGQKRIGKDAVLYPLVQFFEDAASEIDEADDEAGWGDSKAGKKLLVFSEVLRPGDRKFENSLKTLCAGTASGISRLNLKGGSVVEQPNLYSIYAMSNHLHCLHLDPDDARWFVISSMNTTIAGQEFYQQYFQWVNNGGVNAVIQWLLARDLSNFSWGCLPYHTDAYREVSEESRTEASIEISQMIQARTGPFTRALVTPADVKRWLVRGSNRKISFKYLSSDLQAAGCVKLGQGQQKIEGKVYNTPKLYAVENVEHYQKMSARELYDAWYYLDKTHPLSYPDGY